MLIVWSFYFCLRQCTSSESKFVWRLITDKDQDILGKKKARKGQSARAVLDSQWLNLFYITPVVFFISCNQRTAEKLSDWKCQSVVWSRTILKIYTVPSNIFAIYCIYPNKIFNLFTGFLFSLNCLLYSLYDLNKKKIQKLMSGYH